jgi:hypothetical protein
MKIKIIDILNKIANGEEPPNKIMFKDKEYEYFGDYYWCDGEGGLLDNNWLPTILNDEVEILETTITYKPDKIEKIVLQDLVNDNEDMIHVILANKINEIIDRLNND